MDPNIMKLLEEDEDETMHSGADVDALQAALNRDIGGDVSTPQPSDLGLSHESIQTGSQEFPNWQTTSQHDNADAPNQQDRENAQQQQYQGHSSAVEPKEHAAAPSNLPQQNDISQEPNHLPLHHKQSQDDRQHGQVEPVSLQTTRATLMHLPDKGAESSKMQNLENESQFSKLQKMGNQQSIGTEQAGKNQGKQIPFMMLLPALKPHLDKDREMQLQTLFTKLRKNDIAKDQFVRLMRNVVGDQVLRMAVSQLQSQANLVVRLQPGGSQSQLAQALTRQQHVRMPVSTAATTQFSDPSHNPSPPAQLKTDPSYPSAENNAPKSREVERRPDSSYGMQVSQMSPSGASTVNQDRERTSMSLQGQSKQPQHQQQQQQQHMHFPQTTFPMYGRGTGGYHPYSGTNVNAPGPSAKPQPHDLQMRPIPHNQNLGTTQLGGPSQPINMMTTSKLERQNSFNDPNRAANGPISDYANKSSVQQHVVPWQAPTNKEQNAASFSSMNFVKQESLEQAPEQQYKSQLPNSKAALAAPVEQGIAISGNLTDEASSKVGFPAATSSAATNSVTPSITTQADTNVQAGPRISSVTSPPGINAKMPPKKPSVGQKKPLEVPGSSPPPSSKKQKVSGAFLDQSIDQLNDVTAVSGVNLRCVEERMRGLISNLIRLSKQRVDAEKPRHRTVITSDIRQQITVINKKAREEWEKKQAEAEKLRKVNDPEGDNVGEGDKDKDEGRGKMVKVNKEEDDKMRTTAANVAARAAVGGDDMLSKWQLMAEQARQKREGGTETASGSQSAKDANRKLLSSGRHMKDNHDGEKRSSANASATSGTIRKFGRNQVVVPRVARSISVKDVIAVLEREPQMSKSTLIYRLYDKIGSDAGPE
ncbi:hypothetical protein Tsubulata_039788 [Turnera subulata]|uniref:RST domain-containing protein n=1 Tax=Turnera subulata TaxID=218843 RepID=A0A9Q0JCJ7_9ROSI|nr:hypothetical protein Tsubulata_039788 [Turnera subulata]